MLRTRTNVDQRNKENSTNLSSCRKAVSWNLGHPGHRLHRQMTVSDAQVPKQVSACPCLNSKVELRGNAKGELNELRISANALIHSNECRASLKSSTDSGIAGCRSGPSSQSSTSSNPSCYCSRLSPNSPSLHKSNSCSTLPSMLLQAGQRLPPSQAPVEANERRPVPLQKTSSCSSLMSRNKNVSFANVPIYSDSMMHVYAEVASVVPDGSASQARSQSDNPTRVERDYIYDTVKSPPVAVPLSILPRSPPRTVNFHAYKPIQSTPCSPSNYQPYSQRRGGNEYYYETKAAYSQQNIATPIESFTPANRMVMVRGEDPRIHTNSYATLRPATTSSEGSERPNGHLKSALKHSKTASHYNVYQFLESPYSPSGVNPFEAEYAMVDKSKKHRFTSLPTLSRYSSNTCVQEEEKDQPPVPPKKNLHKCDFNLHRSRSSSPKKGFRERVNVLTKSAKNAFQRAFSTERIYRPEREERLEATGFHRSKSFIKGLRASLSKKRKKNKPPMAEVVPQASCNPLWDEQPSGPNSPVQVRGQLLQLNLDGSQVVELCKPPTKPYGFFVARGRVRSSRGVFVSRMKDQETQKQLAGLLDIGDEILEIEGHSVKDADIMEVNNLMANKNTLLLTVLPYIFRKDI